MNSEVSEGCTFHTGMYRHCNGFVGLVCTLVLVKYRTHLGIKIGHKEGIFFNLMESASVVLRDMMVLVSGDFRNEESLMVRKGQMARHWKGNVYLQCALSHLSKH